MKKHYFVFHKDYILLEKHEDGSFNIPYSEVPPTTITNRADIMTVTAADGEEVLTYSVDIPVADNSGLEPCGLRESYYKLPYGQYLKAGKCKELLYWDHNSKFCGACGGLMQKSTDISKKCSKCGKEVWPQLATAVIVLISKGNDILLVHAKNFRGNFYGLVAGFVETGETLEQAVSREVLEETGLKIKNIKYFGSQPWPYPCGLMIGFTADYQEGEISLQQSELTSGSWFDAANLPTIPEKLSIARMLIDDWLKKQKNKN